MKTTSNAEETLSGDKLDQVKDIICDMMMENNDIGMVYIGSNHRIQMVDSNYRRIMGISKDRKLVGLSIEEALAVLSHHNGIITDQLPSENLPKFVKNVIGSGNKFAYDRLGKTVDGRTVQISSWFNGENELISIVKDISEDVRHRNLLEMAVEAANAGYWSVNFVTNKYSYSKSVESRLTPNEIKRMSNQGLWAILHQDDVAQTTKTWQGIMAGNHPFDFTYRVITEKEGEMWQRSVGQLERGADGKIVGATAFVTDVTERVLQRRDLLAERETSKAQSEFLARMSHEIRTPLNAIIGMADSLEDEDFTPDVRDVIQDIEHAAEGLHSLLSKTLDHAKIMSSKMEINLSLSDPRKVLETCTKLWRPQSVTKNLGFTVHVDENVPDELLLDEFRLQQCLNNLLSNAVKFTQKGKIVVQLKTIDLNNGQHLVLAVRDTGIGMNEAQQKTIFDPFVQADGRISRTYGGTGLGTSIAKQMTELMGGVLKVKSELGKGTTFAMIIPILESEQALKDIHVMRRTIEKHAKTAPMPARSEETAPTRSVEELTEAMNQKDERGRVPPPNAFDGLSVLCVEDNPLNQKVVGRLIGRKVSHLKFADNGREAIDALGAQSFDVVLMDIHMPIMNGIEATMQIRESGEAWANVAIIALTADPDYQQKSICRHIGMNGTIAKPVRRKDIMAAFDQVLKQQLKRAG